MFVLCFPSFVPFVRLRPLLLIIHEHYFISKRMSERKRRKKVGGREGGREGLLYINRRGGVFHFNARSNFSFRSSSSGSSTCSDGSGAISS